MKALSRREDFVPDVSAQYHVQEIMHVFVVRNDARRNVVILYCEMIRTALSDSRVQTSYTPTDPWHWRLNRKSEQHTFAE